MARVITKFPHRAHSQLLRKSDPVHQLYVHVLALRDLDEEMKKHLKLVIAQYLPVKHDFFERVIIQAGLSCYVQSIRLLAALSTEKIGTLRYRNLSAQYRAYVEAMAKSYRLRGLKTPARWKKDTVKKPMNFSTPRD